MGNFLVCRVRMSESKWSWKARCSKTIHPATGLGPAALPRPQAEVCSWGARGGRPRTGGMGTVTLAARCLKPSVTFLPSLSNILGDDWESERVQQFFKHALHFFLSLFWHRCFALLFVNGSWLLNLPRHLLLLQLVPLNPPAVSALLLVLVLGQPTLSPVFPNSISLYFLMTWTNLLLYLPTITGFPILLITPACQLSKKITYALNFPLTLINEWLQHYITCLCLACAVVVGIWLFYSITLIY